MKNTILFLTVSLFSLSCKSQKISNQNKQKGVGIPKKTANPNTPYIYKNGFLNFDIVKIPVIQKQDTINLNELKFYAVESAMYTKKVMYDNFGKWTKEIRPNNERHPILVWEKVKLLEDDNQVFTVYANGDENWNEIYASVLVYDQEQNDCLKDENPTKQKIITYFSNGIQNMKNDNKFYEIYWDSVNKFNPKK